MLAMETLKLVRTCRLSRKNQAHFRHIFLLPD